MFKDVFVHILQEKGITAYKVAKGTGLSTGLLADYKSGRSTPSSENLVKIATYLGVSVDELLGNKKAEAEQISLSDEQKQIMEIIDGLSDEDRAKALDYIHLLSKASDNKD